MPPMINLFNNSDLDAKAFLRDYWQRKPLLLRQAFPGFQPQLDADDIAGLACEELAEARLVTGRYPEGPWNVRYGPFDEPTLSALPERDWTLLVQDVEKHYPPLRELLTAFDFLPRWRIDDLMVSIAGPGGSVGPHVDQYDVFLLQAAGRRRWQLARRFSAELEPDCDLRVLRRFESEQEWLLEPGDVLYLPPGVAHFGVAEERGDSTGPLCMTWSIGMRAPSVADLLQSFGEWLAAREDEGGRYCDPGLEPAGDPGEIGQSSLRRLGDIVRSSVDDPEQWLPFLGAFLSSWRLAHEPAAPPRPLTVDALRRKLGAGGRLRPNPWSRFLWLRTARGALLFAGGSPFECRPEWARSICHPSGPPNPRREDAKAYLGLLCELVNRGHLYIETV